MAEEEDLTGVSWNDTVFLSYFPLNKSTVLEYFSRSPFYDRSCLNEQYKMQRLELSAFEKVPGILFEVEADLCVEPALFVISKLKRSESLEVSTLAYYYIINGNTFQAPRAHAVLSTRIVQSMFHMKKAFAALQESIPGTDGDWFAWMPRFASENDADTVDAKAGEASIAERQTVDRLLYGILERNRRVMKDVSREEEENHRENGDNNGHSGENYNASNNVHGNASIPTNTDGQ
mmetsp:Transcript_9250/g.27836  ORF Transcript_9250/g.27836 Transcript_9250/m.27836 type:complete len:234 (+) Transcript_9250:279-980(+)|eukprot:CAMPEP_0198728392 /NCGR_PEP_ID=MMETSP1475-20131203/9035_1 /TAXON_ID= ORGANISM="Unidentified sp., Strain CCMP1999" /NCGR_SAMPLE_ID=MMETSP1475 /ASSEMBLY_ACC=CAM_ASM_001111 /LENGTH=233 /DNA_ID=CAMNT_0044490747 /DNA_START=223 /DNA_END=924 /DNA_ORIENTATION=-